MKKGWEIKKIGDVCGLMTGGTPSRSKSEYFANGKVRWLVSGDVHQKEIFDCEGRITEAGMQSSSAKYLPINSVLMALNGQGKTRGTVALLRTKATCNQSLVSIYPNDVSELMPEFLYHNLNGRYEEIRKITGDDNKDRRGLNMPLIRNIEIPIPPIPEQQRIVSVLDEAFASIAQAKANAERNLVNARELFESVLGMAFDENWEEKRLDEICEVKDGTHDTPQYIEDGIPFVTQKNIREYGLSFSDTKFIALSDHEKYYKRSNVTLGDILISMIGANRGMACIVDDERVFSIKNVGLIKSSKNINQSYLLYFLKSSKAKKYVSTASKGGAQEFVGLTELRKFPILLAPLAEQSAIVGRLEALSAETERLAAVYRQKVTALDELKKSVLQRAFEGSL